MHIDVPIKPISGWLRKQGFTDSIGLSDSDTGTVASGKLWQKLVFLPGRVECLGKIRKSLLPRQNEKYLTGQKTVREIIFVPRSGGPEPNR